MMHSTSIGLGVHARSISAAAFVFETGEVSQRTFGSDPQGLAYATSRLCALRGVPTVTMGNQDTRSKGDSASRKKGKCITFWVTEEQKQEISAYAAEHNTTVSRLIIEGLEMRMKKDESI